MSSRLLLCAVCGFTLLAQAQDRGSSVATGLPPNGKNDFYVANRAPLLASPLIRLPIRSIRPEGWLRRQLELEADGFTGHLTEISKFCRFQGNAWTTPNGSGEFGWEEVPYWLKGFTDLGYILRNGRITAESRKWIEAVLSSQRSNGYFGSQRNLEMTRIGPHDIDLWPNMVMLYPLRSYYDATGDKRVLDFMVKYFRWQMTVPLYQFLPASWQKWRGGDNLDSIYWLYNRTGQAWLLDLARVNHERTADWTGGIPTWHGVNISQCFREPAQYYQQTHDMRYLQSTERDYNLVMSTYGQVPGGMFGADENARPGFTGPRQGSETCAMVEIMHSHEMLLSITGNPVWADRAEEVAFNSLPASMTPDLKGLHYLTAPNQVQLDRTSKAPMIQNRGDMFSYNPYQYRCCQHNVAFGWPYFSEHLWMATRNNGIAAVFYVPSEVTARVGDGTSVRIAERTNYPFDGAVHFRVGSPKAVRFPLALRIPGWCQKPRVTLNGRPVTLNGSAQGWVTIERTWKEDDTVSLDLPMKISVKEWRDNKNSVSIYRGPLAFSLRIGERWQQYGNNPEWPDFEVYPTTPWNFALKVNPKDPAASISIEKVAGEIAPQPFTPENAPIVLRATGERIPDWRLESNGLIGRIPASPARSAQSPVKIELIPMGCTRLRVSAFPWVTDRN